MPITIASTGDTLIEPNDVEEHGREILAQAKLGTYGTIADYDPNREPTEAIQE